MLFLSNKKICFYSKWLSPWKLQTHEQIIKNIRNLYIVGNLTFWNNEDNVDIKRLKLR